MTPKSRSGAREVPFPGALVPYLRESPRRFGLVFGPDGTTSFLLSTARTRALRAWGWSRALEPLLDRAQLDPITLHECRHTYASLMLAAGIPIVKVSKWMGHASIQITVDRYGYLGGADAQ